MAAAGQRLQKVDRRRLPETPPPHQQRPKRSTSVATAHRAENTHRRRRRPGSLPPRQQRPSRRPAASTAHEFATTPEALGRLLGATDRRRRSSSGCKQHERGGAESRKIMHLARNHPGRRLQPARPSDRRNASGRRWNTQSGRAPKHHVVRAPRLYRGVRARMGGSPRRRARGLAPPLRVRSRMGPPQQRGSASCHRGPPPLVESGPAWPTRLITIGCWWLMCGKEIGNALTADVSSEGRTPFSACRRARLTSGA